jgi:hypothetical protein
MNVDCCLASFLVAGGMIVAFAPRLVFRQRTVTTANDGRKSQILGVVLFGLFIAVLVFSFAPDRGIFRQLEDAKIARAKADVVALTEAVEAFHRLTGAYPDSLEVLTRPQEGEPLVEAEALMSPWGQPYQYDAGGPRNQGKQPDIWIQAPDGEVLGNWVIGK